MQGMQAVMSGAVSSSFGPPASTLLVQLPLSFVAYQTLAVPSGPQSATTCNRPSTPKAMRGFSQPSLPAGMTVSGEPEGAPLAIPSTRTSAGLWLSGADR